MDKNEKAVRFDHVDALAGALSKAWIEYSAFYGEEPHGTHRQLAAMIELAGGSKMLRRLARLSQSKPTRSRKS